MKRLKFRSAFAIVLSFAASFTSVVGQDQDTTKRAIDDLVKEAARRFESSKIDFIRKTKLNDRTVTVEEKFSYLMSGKEPEVLAVRYLYINIEHEEVYYFKNGTLIYSMERRAPVDGPGAAWSGVFYFQNGKLLDFTTNGHGKSELDDWDPEADMLWMSRRRMKQLKEHLRRGVR